MQKLSELIQNRLHNHKLHASAKASEVVFRANECLLEYFPDHQRAVKAISIKQGVLLIEVKSSVWSQELWSVSDELLQKLQKEFGEKMVQKIRTVSV